MTLIVWGIIVALAAWFVCRWLETKRELDDVLDPEYESSRRRHPAGKGITPKPMGLDDWGNDEPVTLFGRQVYSEDDVTQEEWQAMFDAINTRLLDEATKHEGEQK